MRYAPCFFYNKTSRLFIICGWNLLFCTLVIGFIHFIALSVAITAHAQQTKMRAGTLICKSKGGIGLIVGSNERVRCTYKPIDGGHASRYRGTITRIGLDLGIKGQSEIVWDVLGSSTSLSADTISGEYVGVAADAAVGVGGGAQILLGGSQKSVVLQPLSIKGQTGLNISVGVAGLTLRKQ